MVDANTDRRLLFLHVLASLKEEGMLKHLDRPLDQLDVTTLRVEARA